MIEYEGSCHIYLRVSTNQQVREGQSLQNQRLKCEDYAKKHNYRIIDVYEDKGVSGKSTNRKEFQRMMKSIRKGDIIIVNAFSRLGRNLLEMSHA